MPTHGPTPKPMSEDEYADELVKYHQQLVQAGACEIAPNPKTHISESNKHSEELASAKRVIELLARVRPKPQSAHSTLTKSSADTETPVNSAVTDHPGPLAQRQISDDEIPSTIGRFEIKSLIGQGGFGLVFLAHDPELQRSVALKVPQLASLLNRDSQARFEREGRVLGTLSHPGIVPVYEVGCDGPISYIASAYIPGKNLAEMVQQRGALTPRNAARIVRELAGAIQHAHSRGVIHRDLKPANVLFDLQVDDAIDHAPVKVADFGLAKLVADADTDAEITKTGSILGTPAFAAPEQLKTSSGAEATAAVDIYSLGAILYYLLLARAPFEAANIPQAIRAVINEPAKSPTRIDNRISADLSAICLRCLEKSPQDRYATAHELQRDLSRFLDSKPVEARPLPRLTRGWRWCARNPIMAGAAATVVVCLLVVSLLLAYSEQSRRLAVQEHQRADLKARQLTDAIERLFIAIADSPSIHMDEAAPVRARLLSEANLLFKQIVADDPNTPSLQLEQFRTMFRLAKLSSLVGDSHKALKITDELLSRAQTNWNADEISVPEWLEWYEFSAKMLNEIGSHTAADERFTTAFEQLGFDPNSREISATLAKPRNAMAIARALSQRANIVLEAGDLARADEIARLSLRLCEDAELEDEGFDPYSAASCHFIKASLHASQGEFGVSTAELNKAIELLEQDATITELRPIAHQELMASCWHQLGIASATQQQLGAARESYIRAIELSSEIVERNPRLRQPQESLCSSRYSLAVTELMLGNANQAESLVLENNQWFLERLTEGQINPASLHIRLANNFNLLFGVRQQLDDSLASAEDALQQAIHHCDRALEIRPQWPKAELDRARAINNLGNIYFLRKEMRLAKEQYHIADQHLQKLLDSQPNFGTARQALAMVHFSLTKTLAAEKQFAEALVYCRLAIENFDGQDPRALLDEAVLEGCLGTPATAYKRLEQLIASPPKSPALAIYGANLSSELAHTLSTQELSPSAVTFLEQHSFDQLAIEILRASLPAEEPARMEYLNSVAQAPSLGKSLSALRDIADLKPAPAP